MNTTATTTATATATTATPNNARDYAQSVAEGVWNDYHSGHVFGLDDEGEELSAWDYLSDCLDYDLTINADMSYSSGRVWITLGGPNAHIDTDGGCLVVNWGGQSWRESLPGEFINRLDEVLAEHYETAR